MKKTIFLTILALSFAFPTLSLAHRTTEVSSVEGGDHTAREEAEGKEIWEKLQAKEQNCDDLSDDDFGALGEHFMGQMMGDFHEVMNNMMIQMMNEEGEEQMHVAMGKRMSGCEEDAPMPQSTMSSGMMGMMAGGGGNSMPVLSGVEGMGTFGANSLGGADFGFGSIFMIFFWGLVILGVVALIKWLMHQSGGKPKSQSLFAGRQGALHILKERYAKGEIDKKEFEEKKKDLS